MTQPETFARCRPRNFFHASSRIRKNHAFREENGCTANRAIGQQYRGDRHFAQPTERIAQYTSRNSAPGHLLRCASRHADDGAFPGRFSVFDAICAAQNARGVPRRVKRSAKTGWRKGRAGSGRNSGPTERYGRVSIMLGGDREPWKGVHRNVRCTRG